MFLVNIDAVSKCNVVNLSHCFITILMLCFATVHLESKSLSSVKSVNVVSDEVFARSLLSVLAIASQKSRVTINVAFLTAREISRLVAQEGNQMDYDLIVVEKSQLQTIPKTLFSTQELSGLNDTIVLCGNTDKQYAVNKESNILTDDSLTEAIQTNIVIMGDLRTSSWGVKTYRFLKTKKIFDQEFFSYARNIDAAIIAAHHRKNFSAFLPKLTCEAMNDPNKRYYEISDTADVSLIGSVAYKQEAEEFVEILSSVVSDMFDDSDDDSIK